jgi:hypothetical protein
MHRPAQADRRADGPRRSHLRVLVTLCMVDQDLPHQIGRDSEEVRPVVGVRVSLVDKPQISFIDECRRLQSMSSSLPAEICGRKAAQFGVQERYQLIQRRSVAIAPGKEQTRRLARSGFWRHDTRTRRNYTPPRVSGIRNRPRGMDCMPRFVTIAAVSTWTFPCSPNWTSSPFREPHCRSRLRRQGSQCRRGRFSRRRLRPQTCQGI